MLIPSTPRKMKACYSVCFKLLIHNFIDQESFLSPHSLSNRMCLWSSKIRSHISLPLNFLWTSQAPVPAQNSWWETRLSILLTTCGGHGLCSATARCVVLSHIHAVTAATRARAFYHTHKIFIFIYRFGPSCGNIIMMFCLSWAGCSGVLDTSPHIWRTHMN